MNTKNMSHHELEAIINLENIAELIMENSYIRHIKNMLTYLNNIQKDRSLSITIREYASYIDKKLKE
jgi:hypothetical protein